MKRRSQRAMILTAAVAVVFVVVLVVSNWGAVRDHVEGWHVILTEAAVVSPRMRSVPPLFLDTSDIGVGMRRFIGGAEVIRNVLGSFAAHADRSVITTPECAAWHRLALRWGSQPDMGVLESYGWGLTKLAVPRVIVARPPESTAQ